ncbi:MULTISPECIES: hypothetical protein [Streptomyces]|uniref:hypothetical protein n=1 Tax=Streptomyces TaxID=1883 RepID=UPI0005181AEF|nr:MULTISPECIES: hypothetical protein [Streptomyces]KOT74993.1 hypothetical protein ADK70_40400 [Streptomyces rimosus subsp. pseudoverticillatus]RSO11315.1 hypothetical protein DMH18_10895 [Streptomyces sp. WAC 06783]RSO40797.1 hypothetical protein DMH15_14415 [Streptomyces sp. WAC 06725]
MTAYVIRYADRAARCKAALGAAQRASLEELEKRLSLNPFGAPAKSHRDDSWSATFEGGFVQYVVSNRHVVINVIDLVTA